MLVTTNMFTRKPALEMKHQFKNILGSKLNSMLVTKNRFTANLALKLKCINIEQINIMYGIFLRYAISSIIAVLSLFEDQGC